MIILGLNASGYNTASALLVDGELVYAVEEERLIREKRTRAFPSKGIRAALDYANLGFDDIDVVAIGWNPAINLEVANPAQMQRNRYLGEMFYSIPGQLMGLKGGATGNYAASSRQSVQFLDGAEVNISYVTHHQAHAASFLYSPFEEAAILTADAFGEKQSVTFSKGQGNKIEPLWDQEFPHALGSLYACFTEYCGFKPQSDEWKLMGASPYGDPDKFIGKLRRLVSLNDGGGFELDLRYFNHYQFHRPGHSTPKMADLLGIEANVRDEPLSDVYYDLAASAQKLFEEMYFHMLRGLHARIGSRNLVIAGGTALNSVANGKVCAETPFENLFVPPVPDDSGCSTGAAFFVHNQLNDLPRKYAMKSNYLGPEYDDAEIQVELARCKIEYEELSHPSVKAAELIADGNILGWFQGRLEFGDRALGNRSILADPRREEMKNKVNDTVKYREPFRPFAPSILAECLDEYFVDGQATPFMERVFPIREEKRMEIPAVTHIDGSGRLQTVTREQNSRYYDLISAFKEITGVPVVLNTSFNLKGEAVVESPRDAVRTFYSSGLDALIMGQYLIRKSG
jgi:carbamoyltransferase